MAVYIVTNEGNDLDGACYMAYSLCVTDGKLERKPVNVQGTIGWDRLDFFREALKKADVLSENTRSSILNGFFSERGSKKRLCKIADSDFEVLIR